MSKTLEAYEPLNVLKPVAPDLWIVDGPTIRFNYGGVGLPFPTRMTVLRLAQRRLLVHSPTALTPGLRHELSRLGSVAWLVGPNRLHYWWLPEWVAEFPHAQAYLAPRVKRQAGRHIAFQGSPLDRTGGYPWDDAVATLPVFGRFMTEVVFFHRPSRTLILTDLIENFESRRLGSRLMRWLVRLGGVEAPTGGMARDLRLTFPRGELRAAVEQMIAWDPERVIIAHGRWFARDGAAELRRAFRWLLD
jgi:hypothetical protein